MTSSSFPIYRVMSQYIRGKNFTQWMSIRNGAICFNNDFDDADHFTDYAKAEACARLTWHDINTGAAHPDNFHVVIEERYISSTFSYGLEAHRWEECRFDISAVVTTLELL